MARLARQAAEKQLPGERVAALSRLSPSPSLSLASPGSSPRWQAGDVGQQDLSYLMTQLDRLGWQAERAEF